MKVLTAAAICAWHEEDFEGCARYDEERLPIARALGDKQAEAFALNSLGTVATEVGDFDSAESLYERSAELATEARDNQMLFAVTMNLGEPAWSAAGTSGRRGCSKRGSRSRNILTPGFGLTPLRSWVARCWRSVNRSSPPSASAKGLASLALCRWRLRTVWTAWPQLP
jgi:hypothetical protein